MKKTNLYPELHALPPGVADLVTPVSIYLKIRDRYPNAILLESSDYHGDRNSMTYICFDVLSSFRAEREQIKISFVGGEETFTEIKDQHTVPGLLDDYINSFVIEPVGNQGGMSTNGLFGYSAYDAVRYFDTIKFGHSSREDVRIPDINYAVYRFIIAFNHFTNQLYLLENKTGKGRGRYEEVRTLLANRSTGTFRFTAMGEEVAGMTDHEFIELVKRGKEHCYLGDVFQVVLSRQFSQGFKGDEFNVYRALRSINPSPYLFYFDYGGYKLFGSSPEAQLVISEGVARINPIAGTFKRTGDDEKDRQLAIDLTNDQKENAEHVMLVDLARNDLSRNSDEVLVKTYRETQFYSHVIHLVSEVTGVLRDGYNPVKVFADSFPAGTLSGAPKYRAMELIDDYEKNNRGFYGGAIGYFGFNGDVNHAIMIRSFMSRNNTLFYQAGAGIVAASAEENELNEVNNKLGALKKAIEMAADM